MAESFNESDFEAHKSTYNGFLSMVKWSIIGLVVLVLVLYFWIQP